MAINVQASFELRAAAKNSWLPNVCNSSVFCSLAGRYQFKPLMGNQMFS
jgi:hypothetical protein